jgi:uncharacterized protein (TIGR02996 family)
VRLRNEEEFADFERRGNEVVVTRGKIGSAGKSVVKKFRSEKKADEWMQAEIDRLRVPSGDAVLGWFRTGRPAVAVDPAKRAELLAAVIAAPDEDGPRQVMADWLVEAGDPQGELIMLQLALARPELAKAERDRISRQVDEILANYGIAWLAPLREIGVAVGEYRRGFVEVVTIDAVEFLKRGREVMAATPVRKLRILDYRVEEKVRIGQLAGAGVAIEWVRPRSSG